MAIGQSRVARLVLPVGARDHVQGPPDAPVTLLEYGDYECPFCGQAHPTVKAVQRRLGRRLRFAFVISRTEIHPHPPRRMPRGRDCEVLLAEHDGCSRTNTPSTTRVCPLCGPSNSTLRASHEAGRAHVEPKIRRALHDRRAQRRQRHPGLHPRRPPRRPWTSRPSRRAHGSRSHRGLPRARPADRPPSGAIGRRWWPGKRAVSALAWRRLWFTACIDVDSRAGYRPPVSANRRRGELCPASGADRTILLQHVSHSLHRQTDEGRPDRSVTAGRRPWRREMEERGFPGVSL